MSECECDWKNCGHKGRVVAAADHGSIRTSPELCMAWTECQCGRGVDEHCPDTRAELRSALQALEEIDYLCALHPASLISPRIRALVAAALSQYTEGTGT